MFKDVKLKTKIMVMVIGSILIPAIITLALTQIRGKAMREMVNAEVHEMADSQLAHIAKGVTDAIDQAVSSSVRINCLSIAKNAKEGVRFFYDQFSAGNLSEEEAKSKAASFLLSQKIGKSGYIYVLSKEGKILVHPKKEFIGVDLTKHDFIRKQLSMGSSGFLEYMWKNPGEQVERAKCLGQELFEPWGWIISSSGYKQEFAILAKAEIEPFIRKMIMEKKIGRTGYVYVLGGSGQKKGQYIVSHEGKRDGENIWNAKDSDGTLFIQSIVRKGVALNPGELAIERYPWRNKGEKEARMKIAKIIYYAPWDWVIGASAYEDEIGTAAVKLSKGFDSMMLLISMVSLGLVIIVTGLGLLLTRIIVKPINRAIVGLDEGSSQVASASGQISAASQSLAEGSSEQAASIEETSASLEEMSSMTKQTADNSAQADSLMKDANQVIGEANQSMSDLTHSMEEISKASEETSKIIKTIDEIAFQTNLLALNAAVEAARAGEAGAGFAVVADEVRNLALRAAEAARNTAELIEGTVKRVHDGTELVEKTNAEFSKVAESATKVGDLVSEISAASKEQAQGIEEVNTAVTEMDKVTQQNAANAEESASASEEMSVQAKEMKGYVDDLSALVGGKTGQQPRIQGRPAPKKAPNVGKTAPGKAKALAAPKSKKQAAPKEVSPEEVFPLDDKDFEDF